MDNIVGGGCSLSLITQLKRCIFSKNKNIFRHLKLEIALAIPASNDEKYNLNNSAGQGLNVNLLEICAEVYMYQFNLRPNICIFLCLNTPFIPNGST